ncbi:MAG: hypothetical protein QOD93_3091 [Acetobacteraceae bacterium]|nr:hypothetical protein [Acetobacteraceae bacterium]
MLAMQATHRGEFIQDAVSLLPVARRVTPSQRNHQFVSYRHTDPPMSASPRCTPVGSKLIEATGRGLGASQARQCGPRHAIVVRLGVYFWRGLSDAGRWAALVLPYANAEAMDLHWPRSAAASCPALTPWSRRMGLGGISKAAA